MGQPRTTDRPPRTAFLATRFGRRLFGLFVATALLPVAALAVLSYRTVASELRAQADARLHRAARAAGLVVAQRLFALADPDGPPTETETARRLADATRAPRLRVVPPDGSQPARLLLAEPRGEDPPVVRELPREAVFEDLRDMVLPDQAEFMVVVDGRWIAGSLGGDGALPEDWKTMPPARRLVAWTWRETTWLGRARELFLEAGLGADPWTIVVLEPRNEVLGPARAFGTALAAVLALTLLGVPLLAVSQIRRRLVPLEHLRDGAQRIGARDFAVHVSEQGDDEFREVALAFNAMTRDLTTHVFSLDTLLEIDREILAADDALDVAAVLVRRAFSLARCDAAAVALLPTDERDDGLTLIALEGDAEPHRSLAPDADEVATGTGRAWRDAALRDREGPCLEALASLGVRHVRIVPMEAAGAPLGALVLGRREAAFDDRDPGAYLRQLADQAASALSHRLERERSRALAWFDPLTGLQNGLRFDENLAERVLADDASHLAVCVVGVEGIPRILETLGHAAADALLREVAERIAEVGGREHTYRLERAEFALLVSDAERAALVGGSVLEALNRPFERLQEELVLSAFVGVAIHPQDGETPELLLRNARTAARAARTGGRDRYRFYSPPMHARARERLSMESDLRRALRRGELEVAFQPIVQVGSADLLGAEALVRWRRDGTPVAPQHFVTLAEQAGLIGELGAFVLHSACERLSDWHAAAPDLGVHVNVSPLQLRDGHFPGLVCAVLADTGVPHRTLTLEITESTLTEQSDALVLIEELSALGIGLAIDDFGTGYASLAQLRNLPARVVKIDRCFVERTPGDAADVAVVRAIVEMAHGRGLRVVAEGVETEAQLAFLRESGCDEAQGYLFSPPLAADAFAKYLREALDRGAVGEITR